ncbi:helix-turn-helix domain-containing protein [Blastococcus sp. PRF04-17]|uniref:helix-turn-helix domain-containing protein n=1 Tax=Blastococcus sp. PRF04-17 TaxID=2933797 RepID=UPI001FF6DF5F|nr:helix-turn-helix domain-containing protein [Blastococcus sp. PRF04-17]UOY01642.1 helix-turn-helix domain-containing protein [Blastococcus sp. PRF04-17]
MTATAPPVHLPAGFTVLHVPDDDAAIRQVAAANDPDAGRIAVRVRPGMRRLDWLCRDLLTALGVDLTVSGTGRNADENQQLLPVRLAIQQIGDILIAGAEQLTPAMIADLALLAAAAHARLWLVTCPPVTTTVTDALADWCATEVSPATAATAWPGLLDRSSARRPTASVPVGPAEPTEPRRLPLVDATTLLASCRALLPAEQAAWVQARVRAAVADAGRRLDDSGAEAEVVAGWLLNRYDSAGTLTQFVTDLRGLQIAALWRGALVQVDVPTLLGTAAASPSAAARTPQLWRRLRAYRLPVRGAASALAAARLGSTEICAATIADTAEDGSWVRVAGRTITVEPGAAEYVAAQRLLRVAAGAPDSAPLLATSTGAPQSDKGLARLLSEVRTELGVVVTSRLVERTAPDAATTLRRWGVTVTPIGAPVPAEPDTAPVTAPAIAPTAPSPETLPLLDVELICRRRSELRLSRRDVAKHLGVTTAVVSRLESGVNHAEQPLALLLRLAELLGVDLADLLPRPARTSLNGPGATVIAEPAQQDARRLGAALHTLGVLVPGETLAEVLGWDSARFSAAVDALTAAAPATGLRVHRLQNRLSLVRDVDALPTEELQAVRRYDAVRAGLDRTQAHLVHEALTRTIVPAAGRGGRHMIARSNAEKVAAASLVGAGILTTDGVGDLALHPDAAYSLLVPTERGQS